MRAFNHGSIGKEEHMYTLKVGDLLEYDGRVALVTKVRSKSFRYFICSNPNDSGAYFDLPKDDVYRHVDSGACSHHLVGNTTKYRRKRQC